MRSKKYEIDMTDGPVLRKIFIFTIPLILSGVLQLAYNAADIIVVGRYAGSQALAAVGSTTALINLMVNVFIGLSVGASAVIARLYGSHDSSGVRETVHTSMAIGAVSGILVGVLGILISKPILRVMGTPDDVIGLAAVYLRIYFCGTPAFMIYNFGGAVLRAIGDTRRPLYFLTVSGVINIALNMLFVAGMNMSVSGVALATVISQVISAALVVYCLTHMDGSCRLTLRDIRIYKSRLLNIIRIGLPAGVQGSIFSISNVLIQSSVNSFGSIVIAGNSAAANIEGFIYTSMNSFHHTALTFTGQNYGAGKYKRIGRVVLCCTALVTVVGAGLGGMAYVFGDKLMSIYSADPAVIDAGITRMSVICTTYFLCGLMDVMVGILRGMGRSFTPMAVSVVGACGLRILWIYTVFAANRTLTVLYMSYPVSWLITFAAHMICYFIVYNKIKRRLRLK